MKKYKQKYCSNFKPLNENAISYQKSMQENCKQCIYFSSRNCCLDIADSIDTELDLF